MMRRRGLWTQEPYGMRFERKDHRRSLALSCARAQAPNNLGVAAMHTVKVANRNGSGRE